MPKNSSNEITSFEYDEDDTREIEEYWTEERMGNAKPVEMPQLPEDEIEESGQQSDAQDNSPGSIQTIESYDPEAKEAEQGKATPADVKKRPYWNGGKFFFTADGKDMYGTAEFVASDRVIMTAAHCLVNYANGKMYKNFLFKRAYNKGGGQKVNIKCGSVWPDWYKTGKINVAFDYAFLYTKNKSGAGWLGFKTGIPYATWTAIGYPGNYAKGEKMYKVVGSKGKIYDGTVEMLNNPMLQGCSGGAWIAEVTTSKVGGNYAIGLNSLATGKDKHLIRGPLFDGKTAELLRQVKTGNCPKS